MANHFEEKSGIIAAKTPWGKWYQTGTEVVIEIEVEKGTRGKDVSVLIKPSQISCCVRQKNIFKVIFFRSFIRQKAVSRLRDTMYPFV